MLALVLLWLVLVAYYHFDNLDTSLQVGSFDIANGRWGFTLAQVTDPIRPILEPIEDALGVSFILSIPPAANFRMAIVWWLVMVVIFQIILVRTRYGNAVFAVGGNIGAATAQGINSARVKVQNFVLCSTLAGVAAIFEVSRNPGVDPLRGDGWELEVIAMTVIGGALLTGGYGSIIGTMLGVLIFGMLKTGLVLAGMDERMFKGVVGVIMIFAVVLNNMTKRSRR
jgi:simple sugar transport system permease protein